MILDHVTPALMGRAVARRQPCPSGRGLRISLTLLLAIPLFAQQPPMQLTLADAQRLAIQNNPQFSAARLNAAAAGQVPAEYRSSYFPTAFGSVTGVGADSGSRLAAGALNNPVVYNRLGT